jgi:RNA polymerase sigma-70 factor (ECF subfamily)
LADHTSTGTESMVLTSDDEGSAVEAARQDLAAFAPLYRAYVTPIFRYLYSRLGNAGEAEDLTSQVFMDALESLPRYRHRGHFPAWLFSIARHRLLNHWRRRSSEVDIETAEDRASPALDPLAEVVRNEEIQSLKGLIDELEEDEQDLLRLRFVAELSYGEIAGVLGSSEEAAKKRIYRLLTRMESQLEAGHG